MRRRARLTMLAIPALLIGSLSVGASPVLAACDTATSLENGGFEDPGVGVGGFGFFDASAVPPWLTTDVANEIELWGDGLGGFPAGEGTTFAELNANSAGTLYQDVITVPGNTMTWTLQHMGRGGTDVMQVLIGDEATADVNSNTGWDVISADLTDDQGVWGTHTADYVVPAGQTCTRFAFRAVSAGSGDDTVGNFIDDIEFSIATPPDPDPEPTAAPTAPPTNTLTAVPSSPENAPMGLLLIAGLVGLALGIRRTLARDR